MFTSQLQVYDALFSEISPSSVSGSDLSKMALWESRISRQYTTCQLGGQGSHQLGNMLHATLYVGDLLVCTATSWRLKGTTL